MYIAPASSLTLPDPLLCMPLPPIHTLPHVLIPPPHCDPLPQRDKRMQLTWLCEEQLFRQEMEDSDDIRLR